MSAAKRLFLLGAVLIVGLGVFGWSIFANAPTTTYAGISDTANKQKQSAQTSQWPAATPGTAQQPNNDTAAQPKTAPAPSTQPSAPDTSDADYQAALAQYQQDMAAAQTQQHESQCEGLPLQYNSNVANENARHTRALSAIQAQQSDLAARGLVFSGLYQATLTQIDQENAQHQTNLQAIDAQYATDKANDGC